MSETKIKPTADRVIISPHKAEEKTKSGIIIPDMAKNEKILKGTVVAVGPGTKHEETEVKVGDNILFSRGIGTELKDNGEIYLIMRHSDIWAIV